MLAMTVDPLYPAMMLSMMMILQYPCVCLKVIDLIKGEPCCCMTNDFKRTHETRRHGQIDFKLNHNSDRWLFLDRYQIYNGVLFVYASLSELWVGLSKANANGSLECEIWKKWYTKIYAVVAIEKNQYIVYLFRLIRYFQNKCLAYNTFIVTKKIKTECIVNPLLFSKWLNVHTK